jgi:hypothetical protein
MYIYKCKYCGKEIIYAERDCVFIHRETLKYYCADQPIGGKSAAPEVDESDNHIIVADVPRKYVNYPPKSYEQKVHEMWYQQLVDGGVYDIITDQFSCRLGREEYCEYNVALVKAAAKYAGTNPEDSFREIWNKQQNLNL